VDGDTGSDDTVAGGADMAALPQKMIHRELQFSASQPSGAIAWRQIPGNFIKPPQGGTGDRT
jgi:hypothetical protein